MRRKNLETKISLGVLMACLITGNIGFAKEISGGLVNNWDITESENVTINGDIGFAGKIELDEGYKLTINGNSNGIYSGYDKNAKFDIIADEIEINNTEHDNGIFMAIENGGNGILTLGSEKRKINILNITSGQESIDSKNGTVTIYGSDNSEIKIHAKGNGSKDRAVISNGYKDEESKQCYVGTTYIEGGNITLQADNGSGIINKITDESGTTLVAQEKVTIISKNETGKLTDNAGIKNLAGTTNITANKGMEITSSQYGILSEKGTVNVTSKTGNTIYAAIEKYNSTYAADYPVTKYYGSKHSVKAEGGSEVNMIATAGDNALYGVIYAKDRGTVVNVEHKTKDVIGSGSNYIYSSAHGSNDNVGDRSHVVAALYAQNNGVINITAGEGGINHIETHFDFVNGGTGEHEGDSERTIWAQKGGVINITGTTTIKSSNDFHNYDNNGYATNSRGIAITAGSEDSDAELASQSSTVNLQYGADSAIYGDIVSGRGGDINISKLGSISALSDGLSKGIEIQGNALAANGGTLDMDLGEGSTWYGRADDYQDASDVHGSGESGSLFNPAFSDDIKDAGTVKVTLGKGSKWYLTGQSWITSVTGVSGKISDSERPVIDIANSNVWLGDVTSTALTIGTLEGNVRFNMHLDGNKLADSDMLYIKRANGQYDVSLNEAVTTDEINNGHDGLRFATVGKDSNVEFRVGTYDNGFFNVQYEVGTDSYDTSTENIDYNGGDLNEHKPGDYSVKDFFYDDEIATLNETTENGQGLGNTTNFKIVGVKDQDISEGGKTVVNMSKVNYSNAVYMDRLNKRLGEARYINTEEDQGMWVRMRHDRIGKDNEFRIMNTMYELGYDEKQECDNGERRVGAAIDYMDGSSEYTGVGGSGDVSRKGIWLYDTWLGDKGHYSDFVAKWGHLSNDFTLYKGTDKITGDFSNNVYSISAEYGHKKDIGNNWYFEPQVQLQYARVTDANYTTSQGTEVSLDAINSLIARAGFRLGKDLGERSTVYFKADLLHEFLGDQDIAARDKTTDGKWTNVTYGNEGTWCDIGFGFATAMSKTSYAYLDVETSLGNDYEETYQINAGLQWSF